INSLARRLGWSSDELARLNRALRQLRGDGDARATSADIVRVWQDILSRDPDGEIARLAGEGHGPGLPGAGRQTVNEDCTIFALANAANLPYGVVAARATELIRQADWRNETERNNPQRTIERIGLNAGEVIMLAEALGRAEMVSSSRFSETQRSGANIM